MSEKDERNPSTKKDYTKPELSEYGSLKDLTTGGTGHAMESSSGQKPRP